MPNPIQEHQAMKRKRVRAKHCFVEMSKQLQKGVADLGRDEIDKLIGQGIVWARRQEKSAQT